MELKPFPSSISEYEILGILDENGHGGCNHLNKAFCTKKDEIVCIRIFDLDKFFGNEFNKALGMLSKEIRAMKICQHKNLIEYYSCFIDNTNLYFVLEYTEGSIVDINKFIHRDQNEIFIKDEELLKIILFKTLLGIENCHKNGLMHRNIKGDYILVTNSGEIKLAGFFGAAFLLKFSGRKLTEFQFESKVDVSWTAPEILEQVDTYDEKVDIWSFGMTIVELVYGDLPYNRENQLGVYYEILTKPALQILEDGKHIFSERLKELVSMCLLKNPKDRPTASELLKHKYFRKLNTNEKYLKKYVRKSLNLDTIPSLSDRKHIMDCGGKKNGISKETEKMKELIKVIERKEIDGAMDIQWNMDTSNDHQILKNLDKSTNSIEPSTETAPRNSEECTSEPFEQVQEDIGEDKVQEVQEDIAEDKVQDDISGDEAKSSEENLLETPSAPPSDSQTNKQGVGNRQLIASLNL